MKNNLTENILPSQVFFIPNKEFLKWAKKNLKGYRLIDCGAGNGFLSKQLTIQGLTVIPIDLYLREESDMLVIIQDSTTYQFSSREIAIIARPNSGDWIHNTILNALDNCKFVLYIGIKKNIARDIESLKGLIVEKIMEGAGKDDEIVYKISKETNKIMNNVKKFYLVEQKHGSNPECKIITRSWFESEDDKWINFNGGWQPKSKNDKVIETQEAEDIYELDWLKTSLVDASSTNNRFYSGWLDRDGNFLGCGGQNHDLIADLIFKKSVSEIEEAGYVRIHSKKEWLCLKRMSVEQRNYMSINGYEIKDDE